MKHKEIISHIADMADDYLSGCGSHAEARQAILDLLNEDYPALPAADRLPVANAVLAILDEEDFFTSGGSAGIWEEDTDDADEE